eukprot:6833788-Pyramimonas_sp.AAC.1
MDAALAAASAAGCPCCVLALATEGVTSPGGPDPIELAALTNAQWGYRATSRITHLVPIGYPYRTGKPSPPMQQLFVAQFDIASRALRTILP